MNLLNIEEEKFKTITIKEKKFKIRVMLPIDLISIAQRRMKLQAGNPVSSLTENDFIYFENIAINDVCIEELPEGFKEYESCVKWKDLELIHEVANEIRNFTLEFESKLKKNKPIIGS